MEKENIEAFARGRPRGLWVVMLLAVLALGFLSGCSEEADANAILANSGAAASSCEIGFNGQAEAGDFTDWTILADGPASYPWTVCSAGNFCTSYTWAEKSQTIDLLAKGVSIAALDAGPGQTGRLPYFI